MSHVLVHYLRSRRSHDVFMTKRNFCISKLSKSNRRIRYFSLLDSGARGYCAETFVRCNNISFRSRNFVSNSFEENLHPNVRSPAKERLKELHNEAKRIVATEYSHTELARKDAETLLEKTFPVNFITKMIRPKEKIENLSDDRKQTQVAIHRAFLHLAAKMALKSSSLAVLLTQRAHALGFCFHLTLYKQLLEGIAKEKSPNNTDPVSSILEISTMASQALLVVLDAQFFYEALKTFILHGEYVYAMELLNGMRDRHDIFKIPEKVSVEFLEILHTRLSEEASDSSVTNKEEATTDDSVNLHAAVSEEASHQFDINNELEVNPNDLVVSDLAMIFCENLEETMSIRRDNKDDFHNNLKENLNSILEDYRDISQLSNFDEEDEVIGNVFDILHNEDLTEDDLNKAQAMVDVMMDQEEEEYYDDDDDDGDDDNIEDGNVFDTPLNDDGIDDDYDDSANSPSSSFSSSAIETIEKFHRNWHVKNHDMLCKEVLYLRDEESWNLPDVTDQFARLHDLENSSSSSSDDDTFSYSKKLEERLLKEIMESEGL